MKCTAFALLSLLICSLFVSFPMGIATSDGDTDVMDGGDSSQALDRALAPSQWPMFHGDAKHTGLSPYDASGNPGKVRWWVGTTQPVLSSPTVGPDGTIYFGSDDNNLYAIYPNGSMRWGYPTSYTVRSSAAIDSDGNIYFGSFDNYIYSLYPNGTERWKVNTNSRVESSPVIGPDGTVYLGLNTGSLVALYPNNGSTK